MAKRHKSALKAHRHSEKRRLINKSNKTRLRTVLKSIRTKVDAGQLDDAKAALPQLYSMLDKMIQKGVVRKNAVARYKSRLTVRIQALRASAASAAPPSTNPPPSA